eukprot:1156669-Pelagomonas_calceolata.AAC.9
MAEYSALKQLTASILRCYAFSTSFTLLPAKQCAQPMLAHRLKRTHQLFASLPKGARIASAVNESRVIKCKQLDLWWFPCHVTDKARLETPHAPQIHSSAAGAHSVQGTAKSAALLGCKLW